MTSGCPAKAGSAAGSSPFLPARVDWARLPRRPTALATASRASSLPSSCRNSWEWICSSPFVTSLARPGGNATGVNFFVAELGSKQLGLLHELVPAAARVALLVNPNSPVTEPVTRDVAAAASAIGLQIDIVHASSSREIEAAFGTLVRNRTDALLVGPDALLLSRRVQLAILAARHAIPTIYNVREYAEVGGLMSYGTSQTEAYSQFGIYTGKMLKGAKPGDLPVIQSTTFELVINGANRARTRP
jgi:putative tryptophan/tyrosine transport system substrate-binding protein